MARPAAKKMSTPAANSGKKSRSSNGKGKKNQQQKQQQRRKGKKTAAVQDVYSDDDDEEQEARMNAKMDIDGVYEYEMPDTFEQDSEIEEDEAFNSEDEAAYGMFFQSKTKQNSQKQQTASDDEEDEEDDEANAGGDLLSDMLGTAPASRLSTTDDADAGGDSDAGAFNDSDEEEDEDAEIKQQKQKNLLALVDGLVPLNKKNQRQKLEDIDTQGLSVTGALASSGDGELTLDSLLGGSADTTTTGTTGKESDNINWNKVKKQVRDLEVDGSAALQPALAPVLEERASRKIAYVEKKKDIDLFQPVVRRNRKKETMDFREQIPQIENLTAAALTSKFSAQTSMEKDVEALLKASGWTDRKIADEEREELAQNKVSKEEVIQRQRELAKLRSLMFYEEQKQRRIKKIKSKLYHKIRNSQNKKEAEKHRKQLRELDPEMAAQLDIELAEKRAEERMTLKHTNTSKWVKHQLKRGIGADDETRAAIADQLRYGEELRRKMNTIDSDDDNGVDDDSNDEEDNDGGETNAMTRLQKRLEKQADALVMEIDDDVAHANQAKGLHGMKFMQRAVQKQREKARNEAEKLLREIKGHNELLSDGDDQSSGDETEVAASAQEEKNTKKKNKKDKKVVVTAEDQAAMEKALPKGTLQTGNVSMDKGLSARASGVIAVDLGNGVETSGQAVDVESAGDAKTIELGAKSKKTQAKLESKAAKANGMQTETEMATIEEEEENPWLTSTVTKNKKRNKKANDAKKNQNGVDVGSAIDSLAKTIAKDGGEIKANNRTTTSKKRKLDQAVTTSTSASLATSTEETATPVAENAKKKNKNSKKQAENNKQNQSADINGQQKLSQEELVRRAFAFADEDEDEIAKEKDLIASEDTQAKKGAEIAKLVGMSGWGSWAGEGVKVSYRQKLREQQAQQLAINTKNQVLANRKDAQMSKVLINEKKDKRAAKFAVQDVPYPFTSREEYEMAMRNPLGNDWNTSAATNALTAPKIIKRAGKIINPLVLTKQDKKQAIKELNKKRKAKF